MTTLCEPLSLETGQAVALHGPAGVGKSRLALQTAAAVASGRKVLGQPAQPARHVLYVDAQNVPDEVTRQLQALAYLPADLDGRLHYLSFPSLPPLDSAEGGGHLLTLARRWDAALVVLDSTALLASDLDSLSQHSVRPLTADGRAVLLLSRAEPGPGVDTAWSVRRQSMGFGLRRTWPSDAPADTTGLLNDARDLLGDGGWTSARLLRTVRKAHGQQAIYGWTPASLDRRLRSREDWPPGQLRTVPACTGTPRMWRFEITPDPAVEWAATLREGRRFFVGSHWTAGELLRLVRGGCLQGGLRGVTDLTHVRTREFERTLRARAGEPVDGYTVVRSAPGGWRFQPCTASLVNPPAGPSAPRPAHPTARPDRAASSTTSTGDTTA